MGTVTKITVVVICLCAAFAFRCGREVSGIEVTNGGSCTGKIYNKEKSAAAGAVVRLIPSGYDPSAASDGTIDSTRTGSDGGYFFSVAKTDFYNIIAEKGDVSCIQDSVSLLADGKIEVNPDTLEETGVLAGRIELKPGSDPTRAVLLIPGTNQYASPYDSLGNFEAVSLPAGTYLVKVFTTENGYDPGELQEVTVTAGDTVTVDVRIQTSYAPDVTGFAVTYDSAMMYVILEWDPVDTSSFRSFALHRYVNGSEDSIIMIERGITEFTDDVIPFFEDTIAYTIAAVGDNFKEGYLAESEPFIAGNKAGAITRVPVDGFPTSEEVYNAWWISVNYQGDAYIYSNHTIMKIERDGTIAQRIDGTEITGMEKTSISNLWFDTRGQLYADISYSTADGRDLVQTRTVYKLDDQFTTVASLVVPADSSVCSPAELNIRINYRDGIAVGDDGYIYLHNYCNSASGAATVIKVYDDDFNFVDKYTFDHVVNIKRCSGDTIMTLSPSQSSDTVLDGMTMTLVTLFDRSFNELSSYEAVDVFNSSNIRYIESGYRPVTSVFLLAADLYLAAFSSTIMFDGTDGNAVSTVIFVLANRNGDILGRFIQIGDLKLSATATDNLNGVSKFFGAHLHRFDLSSYLE